MRKFLCLILLIALLPVGCFALAGCKDKQDLKTFYTAYTNINNECPHLTLTPVVDTYGAGTLGTNSVKLDIDYSQSATLSTLVEDSSTKYYHLKHFYQPLLDDSLAPLYFFGEKISDSNKVGDKQTESLFAELNNLKDRYKDIDYYTGVLITSLKATNDENVNLSYLKKLFVQYENAISTAGNLSALINDIYFNTLLSNSNMDYTAKSYDQLSDADLTTISMSVRSRMYYYKAVYANIYTQLYIRNADLADKLIYDSATIPTYEPYDYISKINQIDTKPIEHLRSGKQSIYNNVISLYNLQNNFDQAYKYFNTATSKVAYLDVDVNTSSQNDINYANIISQFANGIAVDSYEILENLVDLLYL